MINVFTKEDYKNRNHIVNGNKVLRIFKKKNNIQEDDHFKNFIYNTAMFQHEQHILLQFHKRFVRLEYVNIMNWLISKILP